MKGALLFAAILTLALLMIPLIALSFDTTDAPSQQDQPRVHSPILPQSPDSIPEATPDPQEEAQAAAALMEPVAAEEEAPLAVPTSGASQYGVDTFSILDESTGQVATVSLRDYVRGAVAAEMPVTFHPEALKAQAVAAHTYALNQHYLQMENPDPSLKGADFSADPSNMKVYLTEETARAFYGDNADLYWAKICDAADSVLGYVLEYQDEPIVAAYHAISAGQTEDAANVWSGSAPYLQASDSEGDLLAPDYETQMTLSKDAVQKMLLTAWPAAELPDDPAEWFSQIRRSDSGYITSLEVGGVPLHGRDIRTLFDLRSHNMDISYNGTTGYFTFTVYGYGHGVGLSQYGADFMARQGYTFDEILRNYYTGVTIKEVALPQI